ncbi:MAG: sigma-54-dependent Fis family transcriptional regulator [Deltaproteobacteria bacterium]|nr:MAG: sigma-54-dependent Fis family transcriptional regulator [Deltaproteobacteria bacterium]
MWIRDAAPPDAMPDSPHRELVGESAAMRRLRAEIAAVAPSRATVLVRGETGTGKGLVARAIHRHSRCRAAGFVHVDCAALSASVIESELFGHERGAFTGAVSRRSGRFELAGDGTIFLDEIGDLDRPLQAKLMRVLEDREFERVGGVETLPMRARVVAATSRDLRRAVREGFFRADLYFRLKVVELRVPPLRERACDVSLLLAAGFARAGARHGAVPPRTSEAFRARLAAHRWPGNVRELMNLAERLAVARPARPLDAPDLDGLLEEGWPEGRSREAPGVEPIPEAGAPRHALAAVLLACGGNVSRAARRLQIPRSTLRYRIGRYGLDSLIPRD